MRNDEYTNGASMDRNGTHAQTLLYRTSPTHTEQHHRSILAFVPSAFIIVYSRGSVHQNSGHEDGYHCSAAKPATMLQQCMGGQCRRNGHGDTCGGVLWRRTNVLIFHSLRNLLNSEEIASLSPNPNVQYSRIRESEEFAETK